MVECGSAVSPHRYSCHLNSQITKFFYIYLVLQLFINTYIWHHHSLIEVMIRIAVNFVNADNYCFSGLEQLLWNNWTEMR